MLSGALNPLSSSPDTLRNKNPDISLAESIETKLKTYVITCVGDKRNWNIKYSRQSINLSYKLPFVLSKKKRMQQKTNLSKSSRNLASSVTKYKCQIF